MLKKIAAGLGLAIIVFIGAVIIEQKGIPISKVSPTSQLSQTASLSDGLIGYYTFDDGTATDSSGAGHSGTVSGATSATGKIAGALSFNGSNNSVNLGSDLIGTGDDTVCAWVYPRSLGASNYTPSIVNNGTFQIYIFGQSPAFSLGATSNGGSKYPSVGGVSANTWNHICVARSSSGSASFYINGALKSTADSGAPMAGYNSLFVGNRSQGDQGFDGIIDEVRVYSKVLQAADVSAVYAYNGVVIPTRDTTAPVISNISTSLTTDRATKISWTTDEASDSQVQYGVATSYGSNTNVDLSGVTSHTVMLDGLTPNTQYNYRVISKDRAGNTGTSLNQTFKTADVIRSVEYLVSVSASGPGTVTGAGPYPVGTQATITAIPSTNATFVSWSGVSGCGSNSTCTFTVTDITNAVANFMSTADTKAPSVPAGLISTANPTSSSASFSWTASTDDRGVAGYNVYRNGVKIATVTTTSYSDSGLSAGTTYSYSVSAFDAAGNASSQSVGLGITTASISAGKFNIGDRVIVSTSTIAIRTTPTSAPLPSGVTNKIGAEPVGITGTIVTPPAGYSVPVSAEGLLWWYVTYDTAATGCTVNSTQTCKTGWSTESYLAKYTPPVRYTLTITKSGNGAGTVTSGGLINCGATCISQGDAGTSVTLTATPATGSVFAGWGAPCSGTGSCTFTLGSNMTINAAFAASTPAGDTTAPVVTSFVAPTTSTSFTITGITLTASDASGVTGYMITESTTKPASTTAGWTTAAPTSYTTATQGTKTLYAYAKDAAGNVSNAGTQTVNVSLPVSNYTVTLTKVGTGVVTSNPTGVNCSGNTCTQSVPSGTAVTYTATPSTGYSFTGWSGACTGTTTCTVTVNGDKAITATFAQNSTKFSLNDQVQVTNSVTGLNVRQTPSTSGTVVTLKADGSIGTVASSTSVVADAYNWWYVNFGTGAVGWAVENYLTKYTAPTAPTATLTANPTTVTSGSSATLTWSSTNATSCTATGGTFAGTKAVSGTASTGALTTSTTYTLTCTGAGGASGVQTVTVNIGTTPPNGGGPTEDGIVPAARRSNWIPGTTVGVIGGIKNRTSIYQTLNAGATSAQIQSAIEGCGKDQVVYLNEGTYNLSSQIKITKSDCTLRGAGMGKTILKGSAWAALLNLGEFPWITEWPSTVSVTGGANEGSSQVTVSSTAGLVKGQPMYIEQSNDSAVYGFGSGSANSAGRLRDSNNVLSHIVNITDIVGNAVTFTPPLNFSFDQAKNVKAVGYNGKRVVNNFGIEDLTIQGSTGGYGVWWQGCNNSWMKGVEVTKWDTFGIEVQYCTNFEMRDSYVHDPNNYNWSKGYSLQFDQSSNALIENNIFYHFQDGVLFQGTSSGNVIGYNLLFYSYPKYNGIEVMLSGLAANHTPFPTKNLYEGNFVNQIHADYYYGPSSKGTALRNFFHGDDPDSTQNRITVNIDSHQWDYSIIGNILGSTGVSTPITSAMAGATIKFPNDPSVASKPPASTWVYGDKTTDNFSYAQNRIYRLGYPYIGNNSSWGASSEPNNSGQLGNIDTSVWPGGTHETLLHGNWDIASNAVVWNPKITSHTIPNSYYLTGKPSWFGSLAWPPYDSTVHNKNVTMEQMIKKIPAGYKFITGMNP